MASAKTASGSDGGARGLPAPMPGGRGRKPAPTRGVALIVALGVLVVLALLGTVFATLTQVERSVARNYIDKVRARLLASSGVEQVLATLRDARCLDIWTTTRPAPWVYYGGDSNADGKLDSGEPDKDGDGFPDTDIVPLADATRPSFILDRNKSGAIDPGDWVSIDGKNVGVSGITDVGTYGAEGNVYSVQVADLGARININCIDFDTARNPNAAADRARYETILNRLGSRLSPPVANLGVTVAAVRAGLPAKRFERLGQLIPSLPADTVERLRHTLTVHGWVDPKVLRPIGLAAGKRRRNFQVGDSAYAYWELRPKLFKPIVYRTSGTGTGGADPALQPPRDLDPRDVTDFGDFEARSPININVAPREVLAAVIEGLKGVYLKETIVGAVNTYEWFHNPLVFSGNVPPFCGQVGILYETPAIGPKTADAIAREILAVRRNTAASGTVVAGAPAVSVFRSYQQLADFFDQLPASVFDSAEIAGDQLPYVRDVLKANFDPNAHLNELNPDEVVAQYVDKTDLTFWTTEFCFVPMGYFEIESLGRVIDGGREIASATVITEAKVYDVHRDTTQADFQRDFYTNDANTGLDLPGDRAAIETRLRKSFSSSSPDNYGAFGHVAAYPEFYMDPTFVRHAGYDGYVGLQSLWSPDSGATLVAGFVPADGAMPNTALNAVKGGAIIRDGQNLETPPATDRIKGPSYDRVIGGVPDWQGSVMPDGAFSEKDTCPGYHNNNFNQHRGTASLWVKPAFEPELGGKWRFFFSLSTYDLHHSEFPYWYGVNVFGLGYLPNHHQPETWDSVLYGSGDGQYFPRSIMAGFCGAFRRWERTWNNQNKSNRESQISPGDADPAANPPNPSEPWWWDMADKIVVHGSPTLNHVGHDHASIIKQGNRWGNLLMRGRWIHIGMVWDDTPQEGKMNLYINNQHLPWNPASSQNLGIAPYNCLWGPPDQFDAGGQALGHFGLPPEIADDYEFDYFADWTARQNGVVSRKKVPLSKKWKKGKPTPDDVPIRLGAVADVPLSSDYLNDFTSGATTGKRYPANYPADATIDEARTWPNELRPDKIGDTWAEGRFYKSYGTPDKGNTAGTLANFTSARIKLTPASVRTLPPAGTAVAPSGGSTTVLPGSTSVSSGRTRLGLFMYTLRVPKYDQLALTRSGGEPVPAPAPKLYWDFLDGTSRSSLLAGSTTIPSTLGGALVTADGTAAGAPIEVDETKDVRYKFWMDAGIVDRLNDPYTATPVIDDVTVTLSRPQPVFLSWTVE